MQQCLFLHASAPGRMSAARLRASASRLRLGPGLPEVCAAKKNKSTFQDKLPPSFGGKVRLAGSSSKLMLAGHLPRTTRAAKERQTDTNAVEPESNRAGASAMLS